MSITEAEFNWAQKCEKPSVIFVPNDTARFALKLKGRTRDQNQLASKAQAAFIRTISQGKMIQQFSGVTDLTERTVIIVCQWMGEFQR
jgi:hypothetical protein